MRYFLIVTGFVFLLPLNGQLMDGYYSKSIITLQPAFPYELTNWEYRQVGETEWKPALVPGTIIDNFIDLNDLTNQRHPYYGDNEKQYQWISEKDWEFHTNIWIDQESLLGGTYDLVFESLHTFAEIYVNHEKYTSNNAFTPLIIPGLSVRQLDIRIVFYSTLLRAKYFEGIATPKLPGGERVYVRAPQYEFGWDWGPRFINMGIRKPVKLILHPKNEVVIEDLAYSVKQVGAKKENVHFFLNGETADDSLILHFKLFLNGYLIDGFDRIWNQPINNSALYTIHNPEVWWPNGSGESNYYELDVRFSRPHDTTTLAHKHYYYTHSQIKLEQEKDEYGESFSVVVNGKKIYAKGANYIPDDSFHPGKNTTRLIQLAKEANMNMLRVWGGGIYPDDEFYIECIKNGIMVWQDFMFACGMYPGRSDSFDVQPEIKFQYERISRFHNIAIWCGNNENDEGWKNWGWQKELNYSEIDSTKVWQDYVSLFDTIIPYANDRFFKIQNYVSSSPKHGWGQKESMTHGDSHYWGVWWGLEPFEKYGEKVPRFMSEFGMQGMPELSTFQKILPDSALNFNSLLFKNHQKHPTGFQTLNHYLKQDLVIPDSLEDYIYATQILQAEALTTAIEAQRRSRPYCMGSLIWQLNDCWPVSSWSLVDSELNTKIAYDAVKKLFEPVIISVAKSEDAYGIYLVNDLQKTVEGTMEVSICDFYGEIKFKKVLRVKGSAGSSKVVCSLALKRLKGFDLSAIYMQVNFTPASNDDSSNSYTKNYHFVRLKDLKLPPPEIVITPEPFIYSLTTTTYCPYLVLPTDNGWKFIGDFKPGNSVGFTYLPPVKSIAWLDALLNDLTKIKTLNSLLKE